MLKKDAFRGRIDLFLTRLLIILTLGLLVSVILLATGVVRLFPSELAIRFTDAEKEYDGTPLSDPGYECTGELPEGYSLRIVSPASRTPVGVTLNEAEIHILNRRGQDVTDRFKISVTPGKLTVNPRVLTVCSASVEREYDGTVLTAKEASIVSGSLVTGDVAEYRFTSEIENVGSIENGFKVNILTADGRNVTSNYSVRYDYGTLTVTPYVISVKTEYAYKPYDGEPLVNRVYSVDRDPLPGHWSEVFVYGSQTEVGESPNYATASVRSDRALWDPEESELLSRNYLFEYDFGTLLVQPPESGMIEGGGMDLTGDDGVGGGGGGKGPSMIYVLSDYTGPIYLREESFGEYNRSYFDDPEPYEDAFLNPLIFSGSAMREAGMEVHTVSVAFKIDEQLLPYYILDGFGAQTNDCSVEQTDRVVKYTCVPFYSRAIREGTFVLPSAYQVEEKKYADYVHEHYSAVPEDTREALLKLAMKNGLDPDSPTLIDDVANYIQNAARYDFYFASGENDYALSVDDSVIYFLTVIREGVCRHYAAAATMMFRTLGLPARYTVGFVGYCEAGQWSVIDPSTSGHAWVEVYIDGCGWVQVEVTGSSD